MFVWEPHCLAHGITATAVIDLKMKICGSGLLQIIYDK